MNALKKWMFIVLGGLAIAFAFRSKDVMADYCGWDYDQDGWYNMEGFPCAPGDDGMGYVYDGYNNDGGYDNDNGGGGGGGGGGLTPQQNCSAMGGIWDGYYCNCFAKKTCPDGSPYPDCFDPTGECGCPNLAQCPEGITWDYLVCKDGNRVAWREDMGGCSQCVSDCNSEGGVAPGVTCTTKSCPANKPGPC